MKKALLLIITLCLWSCKLELDKEGYFDKEDKVAKEFVIPTDWQLDNVRGKVKVQTYFIKDVEISVPIKKEIMFDSLGYRMSEEIWLREENSEEFYSVKKLVYTPYKDHFRSYDTYGAGKSKSETTEVQWFSSNSYSAVIIREIKTDLIDWIDGVVDDQGKMISIEKDRRVNKTQKIINESKEIYLYHDKSYLIGLKYSVYDDPFITYRIDNKSFDKQGNVTEFIEYDENNEISSEVKLFYEYY